MAAQGRPTAKLAPACALATLVQSIRGCEDVRHSADSIRAHRPPNTMLATRGAHDDANALSRALQFETRIVHMTSDISDALSRPDGHDDAPEADDIRRRVKRHQRRNPVWSLEARRARTFFTSGMLASGGTARLRHGIHSDGSQQPRFGSAHGLHRCSCLHHGELRRSALGLRRGRHR